MGKLTQRLGQALGLETLADEPLGSYDADVTPPARSSVSVVSEDRALGLPVFFRGVQLIVTLGSMLKLEAWRGDVKLTGQLEPALIRNPDPWRSRRSFVMRILVCLVLDGNAFLLKHLNPDGSVAGLEVLNPKNVVIKFSPLGVKSYEVHLRGRWVTKTYADIEHIRGLEVYGHDRGLSPLTACRLALGGILDVREYADNWFGSGQGTSEVLTSDQKLSTEEIRAYKNVYYGRNPDGSPITDTAHPDYGRSGPGVRVFGSGLSLETNLLDPEDAQWLEAQNFGILDIARLLGIPAAKLEAAVQGSSLTYANLGMIDTQFLKDTLYPAYLVPIEEALTNVLVRGQEARFSSAEFLRPDEKTQAEIDDIYLTAGVISAEEVRTRKGLSGPAPNPPTPAPAAASEDVPA